MTETSLPPISGPDRVRPISSSYVCLFACLFVPESLNYQVWVGASA